MGHVASGNVLAGTVTMPQLVVEEHVRAKCGEKIRLVEAAEEEGSAEEDEEAAEGSDEETADEDAEETGEETEEVEEEEASEDYDTGELRADEMMP